MTNTQPKPYTIIDNRRNGRFSSALSFDLRNSTKVTRQLTQSKDLDLFPQYVEFVMGLKLVIFEKLGFAKTAEWSINDTGDGFICLLWDELHAWTALKVARILRNFFEEALASQNGVYSFMGNEQLSYGIGLHSGGSIVCRCTQMERDFFYGSVVNSAARIESFTKTFVDTKVILSAYFVEMLQAQDAKANKKITFEELEKKYLKKLTAKRVDVKDAKERGHYLYTVKWPIPEL